MRLVKTVGVLGLASALACGGSGGTDLYGGTNGGGPGDDAGGSDSAPPPPPPSDGGGGDAPGACAPGFADCDGDARNGCEANLATDGTCGSCAVRCTTGTSCQGGQCAQGPAPLVPTQAVGDLACLAVSDADIFWTTGQQQGYVMRLSKGGGTPTPIAQQRNVPRGIAVDAAAVYWTETQGGGTVWRANHDGSNPVRLANGQSAPFSVALDATHVYWTNRGDGTVWRVPKTGGTASPQSIANLGGQDRAADIAVAAGYVYFTSPPLGQVLRAPIAGGVQPSVISNGSNGARGIAVGTTTAYWAAFGSTIQQVVVQPSVGTVAPLVGAQQNPWYIATDGLALYWSNNAQAGSIAKSSLTGAVTPLATGQTYPLCIAVDRTSVYWLNVGGGSVMRVAK